MWSAPCVSIVCCRFGGISVVKSAPQVGEWAPWLRTPKEITSIFAGTYPTIPEPVPNRLRIMDIPALNINRSASGRKTFRERTPCMFVVRNVLLH